MKKITLKLIAFVLFAVSAVQVNAQAWSSETSQPGLYRIQVQGENLALTLSENAEDGAWVMTYEAVDASNNNQVFFISPAEIENPEAPGTFLPNRFSYTSAVDGRGVVEILDNQNSASAIGCRGNDFGVEGGLDIWNQTRGQGTQIFSENTDANAAWAGTAKRRLQNFEEGGPVKISGGGPVRFDFVPTTLSTTSNKLTSNDFSIATLSNELVISSNVASISEVAVYSILGKNVLSESGISSSAITMNTSSLATGMYIVKIATDRGIFSTKIIQE